MKTTILALSILITNVALALPVVNENVANSGVMTIYPDHQDPHRFYIAPNIVTIAKDSKGRPWFSYNEYRRTLFSIAGVMQMTLVPAYTREELEAAKTELLKKDPSAQFSGVPFIDSSLALTGNLPELISDNQCNHVGGLIGQEQSCTMVLTPKGRQLLYRVLERKTIFTTLQFEYSVQAVVRRADGSFGDQLIRHGIAVRIDGDQLSKYPGLISKIYNY
jgi:hypothetical protein